MADYNTDFALWAEDPAAKLRASRFAEVDREDLAEELESLARALRHELSERLARMLQNLLQWEYLEGVRLTAWYMATLAIRPSSPTHYYVQRHFYDDQPAKSDISVIMSGSKCGPAIKPSPTVEHVPSKRLRALQRNGLTEALNLP
ncbi:DUF29 family protein [Paraburkholderia fungorum]|uniref:DUF29 family protein n=1 Tax=Paraburkholderia fungorum TaxID=134537 RepID=UPI0038B788E3